MKKNTPSVDIYPPTACNRCCTTCLQPCLTHLHTSTGQISRSCSLKSYSYIFANAFVSKQETQLIHNVNWQHGGRRKQDTQYDIQNVFMKLKEVHLTSSVFWLHSEGYCNLQDMHHHTADHRRPIWYPHQGCYLSSKQHSRMSISNQIPAPYGSR